MENNIQHIIKNIYSFSYFVSSNEIWGTYSDKLSSLWGELEIVNAVALDEWDRDGSPSNWSKWQEKYQKEAIELTTVFLNELELFFNDIVANIVNNEDKFHILFNKLENDDYFKSKFSPYWNELDTLYFIFNDDREMFVDKYKNELIDLLLKIIHFYPYKFLDASSN